MVKIEFEIGVKHGKQLGEIIIGFLAVSGGGSLIFNVVKTCKDANLIAKTYRRVNLSSKQLLEDSINGINEAF